MKFKEVRIGDQAAQTLVWTEEGLVDWVQRTVYRRDGETGHSMMGIAYPFDSALGVAEGKGCILYDRLGTKAILVYENKIVREWNRSYYHADRYEYPICTAHLDDGRQILVHCPEDYNRLEIEDLFTGERLSARGAKSPDFFHSRLQTSPDKKWLLSAGWFWHPIDALQVFPLDQVLTHPELLDVKPDFEILNPDLEVQSAVFTPDSNILIVTAKDDYHEALTDEETFFGISAGQVGLFSPQQKRMLWTKEWTTTPGSVVVGGPWALCLHGHPRLYRWEDWTFVHEWTHLSSGKQTSSICPSGSKIPTMCFDLERNRFAVSGPSGVTVVEIQP